jgi:hypothetical protein
MLRQLCDLAHMCHRMHWAWKQPVVIFKFGSKYASIVENYLLAVKFIRTADCKTYIGTVLEYFVLPLTTSPLERSLLQSLGSHIALHLSLSAPSRQTQTAAMSVRSTLGATVTKYCQATLSARHLVRTTSTTRRGLKTTNLQNTHRLLVPNDLPRIKHLPRHLSNRPPSHRDTRTTTNPIALHSQLNLLPVSSIPEMHAALAAAKVKVALHFEAVALRTLALEAALDGRDFLLESEELVALHVGEGFGAVDGEDFAFAFADWCAGGGGVGEVVAREGHDFLAHLEGCGCRRVEGWVGGLRAQGNVEGGD